MNFSRGGRRDVFQRHDQMDRKEHDLQTNVGSILSLGLVGKSSQ